MTRYASSVTTSAHYVVDRGPPRRSNPRRGEVVAALALGWVAAHLLLAQLTLVLAVAFGLIGRATRWRPGWLAVPAVVGLVWVLAIGPRAALAGFTAGPRQVLGYLAGAAGRPGPAAAPGPRLRRAGRLAAPAGAAGPAGRGGRGRPGRVAAQTAPR